MTYIIAEIGNTHEGSLGLAKKLIEAAAKTGVNAVKFQTHIFDAESLLTAPNPPYFKDETRKEYFDRTSFTAKQWKELKRFAEEEMKVDFLSSPFSLEAVEVLLDVGVKFFKIPSGEVTNIPMLEKIAKTKIPVMLSSGMSSWQEFDDAVNVLIAGGCPRIILMQCTSAYPCPPEESGLNVLAELKKRYPNFEIGYSDHTLGTAIPIASMLLGATVIEKHFTLSKMMYGSDAKNATEPKEFEELVTSIRQLEKALNSPVDKNKSIEQLQPMKITFEKSIVSRKILEKGHVIVFDDLAFKKPGDGIKPRDYKTLLGKKIKKHIGKDHKFNWDDLE